MQTPRKPKQQHIYWFEWLESRQQVTVAATSLAQARRSLKSMYHGLSTERMNQFSKRFTFLGKTELWGAGVIAWRQSETKLIIYSTPVCGPFPAPAKNP